MGGRREDNVGHIRSFYGGYAKRITLLLTCFRGFYSNVWLKKAPMTGYNSHIVELFTSLFHMLRDECSLST